MSAREPLRQLQGMFWTTGLKDKNARLESTRRACGKTNLQKDSGLIFYNAAQTAFTSVYCSSTS